MLEKEFKSRQSHHDKVTCLTKISDSEFITSSEDKSLKIWDKHMSGCRYTIETHEQLHTMAITGESLNLLIAGYGGMDFIVFGLNQMNQNHISEPPAHDGQIVSVITLSKFKHKYFATRCIYGDFGIWGANKHPDRVLKIFNMDDPEFPQVQEEPPKVETKKKKKSDDDDEDQDEEEELDEDGNPISKEPEPVKFVKDFSNRIASDKDKMIEL